MTSSFSGSCLCGSVTYTLEGEARNFFHCHCGRCRKATGTGHASNLILSDASLHFQSGAENVTRFKVPDAKVFENVFCRICGGRLPKHSTKTGYAVVPAGGLDENPDLAVEARIFFAAGTPWSCHGDAIPSFDKYPSRD